MSVPKIARCAVNSWVPNDSAFVFLDTTKHYNYAFVPGGITSYDNVSKTVEYGEAVERLLVSYMFLKEGIVDTVIISGDGAPTHAREQFMKETMLTFGVDTSKILIEPDALNTYQNFDLTVKQVGLENMNARTLVVNSGMYMRRTILCSRLVGLDADFYIVDHNFSPEGSSWTDYVPSPPTLEEWLKLFHELIGYVSYKVNFS